MNGKVPKLPKLVVRVIYKSKGGYWRGFCSPYDVTCEAKTKDSANDRLQRLVSLYEEGLEKYNYPSHLAIKPLSNREDKKVFGMALKVVSNDIKRAIVHDYNKYQQERVVQKFTMINPSGSGHYYQPVFT